MKTEKPVGLLKFHHVDTVQKKDIAIYYDIWFEDEEGTLWKCHGSSFIFSLEKDCQNIL